jgi:hypothetical protein
MNQQIERRKEKKENVKQDDLDMRGEGKLRPRVEHNKGKGKDGESNNAFIQRARAI